MAGSFLRNFSFTLLLNLLVKLFWVFVIEIAVQNRLGAEAYGTYFESFNFSFFFFILLDLGLSNYTSRTVAGNGADFQKLFSSIFSIKLGLTVFYLAILYGATRIMGYDGIHTRVVMFIGLNHVLMSMMLFLRSNVAAMHLFRTDALLSVADRLVMGGLCTVMLWTTVFGSGFSLDHFLVAQFAGYLMAALLAFGVVYRQGGRINLAIDFNWFRSILRKSYPFALLFFLMGVYTRIDSVMLGRMLPDGEFQVGIYASAFRLLDAAIIFTVLLSNILLPMFSRMISKGKDVFPLCREAFLVVWIASILLPMSTWFHAGLIYPLLYAENHAEGIPVLALLMFNFIPMAVGYVFGTLLTARGELRLLNYISACGLVVNIGINALLIPHWQVMGAIVATLLTQSLVTSATFYFSMHYFKMRFVGFFGFRILGYTLATGALFYLFATWLGSGWISLISSLLAGLLLIPVFRLMKGKDLLQMAGSETD